MSRMPEPNGSDREVSLACKAARGSKPALARTNAHFTKRDRPAPGTFAALSYFLGAPLQAHAPPMPGRSLKAFFCLLRSFFLRFGRNHETQRNRGVKQCWTPRAVAS